MKIFMTFFLAATFAAAAFAQTPVPPPSVGTNQAQLFIQSVVSNPHVGTTVPVGEVATIKYRVRLSDGRELSDIRGLPITIDAYTLTGNGGVRNPDMKCDLALGQCSITSAVPRIVQVSMSIGSLGNSLVTISFFRPNRGMAVIDVTSSIAQANDGNVVTLSATSPITIKGWVAVHASTTFTDTRESFDGYIYMPDGVKYGQKISLNVDEVRPMSFRDRRYFVVIFETADGIVAQGFGNSVGKMEFPNVDGVLDSNGDLVFSLMDNYQSTVEYTATLLRNDGFRVELSTSRNELFAYVSGNRVKLVFNKFSLAENQFYLDPGSYTVNVQTRDRVSGIGYSNSRADALALDRQLVLQ
jgi:hypothetical protein